MKYYGIYWDESEGVGTARSRSEALLLLPDGGSVVDWIPLEFDLVDGAFPDYLANDLGCRICSERMRYVLESSASRLDVLQWLPVQIVCGDEVRNYWVLHSPEPVDVLGKRTIRQGDFVVKPVLSVARPAGHAVLTYPGSEGLALAVNQQVKDALALAGCTGFECILAPVEP